MTEPKPRATKAPITPEIVKAVAIHQAEIQMAVHLRRSHKLVESEVRLELNYGVKGRDEAVDEAWNELWQAVLKS